MAPRRGAASVGTRARRRCYSTARSRYLLAGGRLGFPRAGARVNDFTKPCRLRYFVAECIARCTAATEVRIDDLQENPQTFAQESIGIRGRSTTRRLAGMPTLAPCRIRRRLTKIQETYDAQHLFRSWAWPWPCLWPWPRRWRRNATDIVVATVNNGHMIEMQKLTKFFEQANPDIHVKWVTLEEGVLRQRATTDIATQGGQFDVMTIGMYETPIWGKKGWLQEIKPDASLRRRRPAARDPQRPVVRRQAVRRAVLRRELDADVPQGPGRQGRRQVRRPPDLGPGARRRRQDERPEGRRLRHLPARQAGLGRQHGLPHDHGQRLRRPVVRHVVEAAAREQAVA